MRERRFRSDEDAISPATSSVAPGKLPTTARFVARATSDAGGFEPSPVPVPMPSLPLIAHDLQPVQHKLDPAAPANGASPTRRPTRPEVARISEVSAANQELSEHVERMHTWAAAPKAGTEASKPALPGEPKAAATATSAAAPTPASVDDKSRPKAVQHKRAGDTAFGGDDVHVAADRGTSGAPVALPFLDLVQQSFGRHDVTGVRAYVGGEASEANRAMGSLAFARGDQIAFGGAPDLHTAAHEAAHVVQQRGGVSLKDGVGESGDAHERHADDVADRVVRGESAEELLDAYAGGGAAAPAVQHKSDGTPPPPPSLVGIYNQGDFGPSFLNEGDAYLTGDLDKELHHTYEGLKTLVAHGAADMAQPALDEVDSAYGTLKSAFIGGTAKIGMTLASALMGTTNMSHEMAGDFENLKALIQDTAQAGDELKLSAKKLEGSEALLGAVMDFDKSYKLKLDNAKDQVEKEKLEKEQREYKEQAEHAKKVVESVLDDVKDVALAGEIWGPAKVLKHLAKAGGEIGTAVAANTGKSLSGSAIDELYYHPELESKLQDVTAKMKKQANGILYADHDAVGKLREGFKGFANALREEQKVRNKNVQQKAALVSEKMAVIENRYKDAKGDDAKVAAVFAAVNHHADVVGPLGTQVLQKVAKAPRGPNHQEASQDEKTPNRIETNGGTICREGQPDPQVEVRNYDYARHPEKTIGGWEHLKEGVAQIRQRVQGQWESKHQDKKLDAAIDNEEYTEGVEEYRAHHDQYTAYIGKLDQLDAWITQAQSWYLEHSVGNSDPTQTMDWTAIDAKLDEARVFASGPHLEPCQWALDAINDHLYANALGDQRQKLTEIVWAK